MKYLVFILSYVIFVISQAPPAEDEVVDEGGEGEEMEGEEGADAEEDDPHSTGEIKVCRNVCLERDGFDTPKVEEEAPPVMQIECVHGTEAKPLAAQTGDHHEEGGEEGEGEGEEGGEAEAGALKSKRKGNKSSLKKRKNRNSNLKAKFKLLAK